MDIKNENTPSITATQIAEAATNSPALSHDEVEFGGRVFKIVHLGYDEYIIFVDMLQPLFAGIAGSVANKAGVSVPGITLMPEANAGTLLQFFKKDLPEMAAIVLNMSAVANDKPEDKVDVKWIKKNAKSPYQLAQIVMLQVTKNRMIEDFASFFVQAIPSLVGLGVVTETKSLTPQQQ
jgi:hypothetical protein